MRVGWNWLINSKKWHFFQENGRSLCGRFLIFKNDDADPDNKESPDNCAGCWKKAMALAAQGEQHDH